MKCKKRHTAPDKRRFISGWRSQLGSYAGKCLESGFLPKTFRPLMFLGRQLARLMVFVQVGKVRIIGAENLEAEGQFIICPNHSSMLDAPVMYSILKRREPVRYMTAMEVMRGWGGMKAVLMGALGCFAVDRSRGRTVIEPAIKILLEGESLIIFPEGRVSETEECQPFQPGPAIIGLGTWKRSQGKKPDGIIPVHIHYHRRHDPTAREGYGTMGLKWRGGVTITIGKPIKFKDLPKEDMTIGKITTYLHNIVCRARARALRLDNP